MLQKINITTAEYHVSTFQKTALFILCILIPLSVGRLSSSITSENIVILEQLNKPPFFPPNRLFPIVWTALYVLMGIASYLILISDADPNDTIDAMSAYLLQLAVNFFWSIFFFNFQAFFFSFLWLVLLWILVALTIYNFSQLSKTAAYLMIPYLVWITFAGYLNLSIFLLN